MARRSGVTMLGDFSESLEERPDVQPLTSLPDGTDDLGDEQEMSDIDRVMHEVGAAGQGTTIKVYRVNTVTRKEAYLFECQTSEFNLDVILQRYGGGTFRVRGYRRTATGGYAPFVNRHIEIEEPKGGIAAINPAAPVVSDRMADLVQQLAAMQAQTQQMIAAMSQNNQPQQSRREMLEEMQMMASVFGGSRGAAPSPDPVAQIKQTLELVNLMKGQEAAASDPTTGLLMTMVEKLAGPIAEGIAAQSKNQQAQIPAQPQGDFAPLPQTFAPLPVLPNNVPRETQKGSDMNFLIKQALASVGAAAAKNEPTAPVAEMIAKFADNSQDAYQVVEQLLTSENWFEAIEANIPGAAAHKDWYGKLRDDLRGLYEDDLPAA